MHAFVLSQQFGNRLCYEMVFFMNLKNVVFVPVECEINWQNLNEKGIMIKDVIIIQCIINIKSNTVTSMKLVHYIYI